MEMEDMSIGAGASYTHLCHEPDFFWRIRSQPMSDHVNFGRESWGAVYWGFDLWLIILGEKVDSVQDFCFRNTSLACFSLNSKDELNRQRINRGNLMPTTNKQLSLCCYSRANTGGYPLSRGCSDGLSWEAVSRLLSRDAHLRPLGHRNRLIWKDAENSPWIRLPSWPTASIGSYPAVWRLTILVAV
jgi:hypothetical protein